jgi:hypothetical protein
MGNDCPMASSVYSRTLQKAADLIGGRKKLARVLRVPTKDLEAWIADEAKPPLNVFLRVVDLIIDETGPASESDSGDAPPPRDAAGTTRTGYED